MNIFYLSEDTEECARWHNNAHCIKMIVEYAQLLSTAHRLLDGVPCKVLRYNKRKDEWQLKDWYFMPFDEIDEDNKLRSYRYLAHTHVNHPSALWAREAAGNYTYLFDLLNKLCAEYTYRYDNVHKYEREKLTNLLAYFPKNIPSGGRTPIRQAMDDEYKMDSGVEAYRNYYNKAKTHLLKWKKRDVPYWIEPCHAD